MQRTKRRDFLQALAAIGVMPALDAAGQEPAAQPARLRTLSYNVLQCTGYPAVKARSVVRDLRREMPRRFTDALRRYAPDVLTFQESPAEDVVREMAASLGMHHVFFPSPEQWPGALITRHEVRRQQNCPIEGGRRPDLLFTRHWGMAALATPMGELTLHSVHLHPSEAETRAAEIEQILGALGPELKGGGSIVLQGDFNAAPDAPELKKLQEAGFVDAFARKGQGPPNTFSSDDPARRIDYVWVHGPIAEKLLEARVLYELPFRRNARDRESFALSDHLPVMVSFGG